MVIKLKSGNFSRLCDITNHTYLVILREFRISQEVYYARANDYLVFTHDLDFGTILALTQAESPSVVQVRAQNILPSHLAITVIAVLRSNQESLEQGALIVVDEGRARVRILPLQRRS